MHTRPFIYQIAHNLRSFFGGTSCANLHLSAIEGIMKRTKGKGINFVVYESAITNDEFFGSRDPRDLNALTA